MPEDKQNTPEEMIFSSGNARSFKLRLGEYGRVQFQNGILKLLPDEGGNYLLERITPGHKNYRQAIAQIVKYMDVALAEKVARAHMEQKRRQNSAVTGGYTSLTGKDMLDEANVERLRSTMIQNGASTEDIEAALEQLKKDSLALTHNAKNDPPVRNNDLQMDPDEAGRRGLLIGQKQPVANSLGALLAANKKTE